MIKNRAVKIMACLIGGLIFTLSIISYQYYQENQEEKRQWKTFINNFYFAIDDSIARINYLIENKPKNERLDNAVHRLERELLNADTIVQSGSRYLNSKIYNTSFFRQATYFLYGLNMNGTEIPPLGEDNHLDETELTLLKTIREYLTSAKEAMYSPKTKQENPNLTIKQINEIIMTHLDYYPDEIYQDAFN